MANSIFRRPRKLKVEIDLPITAMASVFTVIMVFLMKSMASEVSPLQASAEMELPVLSTAESIESSFQIEVSKEAVTFEGKMTEALNNFSAAPELVDIDGSFKNLSKVIRDAQELQAEKGEKPLITIFADQLAPQETVQRAIASASRNGLTQVQLVVVHDEK